MDPIAQALLQQLHLHPSDSVGIWVADENLAGLSGQPPIAGLALLSNRFDLYRDGEAAGWPIRYSDFDFSPWPSGAVDRLYYRVSKEKAVVHHVINQAFRCLRPGGELYLFGAKQEGTKTYFDKARKLFGHGELGKLGKGGFAARLVRSTESVEVEGAWLDDRDYPRFRPIDEGFISKPGLFGWDKLDKGSAFLAEHFTALWPQLPSDKPSVLDLGCGYGYLSVKAFEQGVSSITATDNNAAAVEACRQNFDRLGIPGSVVADDCAAGLARRVELLLCNPPFHQGFGVEGELTDRFLASAARLLADNGVAAFVVNRFIPLERKAQSLFGQIECFADNGSFKLVRLADPKRT